MGQFQRHRVHPLLQQFIQGYWMLEAGEKGMPLHLVPDGFPEIYIIRSGGFIDGHPEMGLIGQFNHRIFTGLLPGSSMLSIKLYPWTPAALFGAYQQELQNMFIPLDCIEEESLFKSILTQCIAYSDLKLVAVILDAFLLRNLDRFFIQTPFLRFATTQILHSSGLVDFDQICRTVHASRRYLELKFKNEIGLSPKQYARLIRVKKASLEMLADNQKKTLREIAMGLGYYDSSHFRKDFRAIVGDTPSGFLMEQHSEIEKQADYLEQWEYS